MKFIKNGRLFGLFNILDIFIFAIIAGSVAGVVMRLNASPVSVLGGTDEFYVTFRIERVREFTVNAVNIDDVIYEQHGAKLGTVIDISEDEPRMNVAFYDGTAAYYPMDGRSDLYITIQATGAKNQNGYYIGGNNHLQPGKEIKIQSNMIYTTARVSAVSDKFP